jgi:hypothetical protein
VHANEGDVSVEPIAAFLDLHGSMPGLYLELRITDPTGAGFSDRLRFIFRNEFGNLISLDPGENYVMRAVDANTTIVSLYTDRFSLGESGDATVRFDTIASGVSDTDGWQLTRFSIGEHIGIVSPIVAPGAEFIEITDLALDNGLLTITHRNSDTALHGWGSAVALGLSKPDGEVVSHSLASHNVEAGVSTATFEIGDMDPQDLTLVWSGMHAGRTVTGNWEFSVSADNVLEPRVFYGAYQGNRAQVTLGATSLAITVYSDHSIIEFPRDWAPGDTATLLLEDGTVVQTWTNSIEFSNTPEARFTFFMNFVNPADVEGVTLFGVTIGG